MRLPRLALVSLSLTALPTAAFAHPGAHHAPDLAHGFMHPIGGVDHVLAMVAVGILAARLGGRALWLVPGAFIATMILGGIAGVANFSLSSAELGIAGSVLVLGSLIASGRQVPTALAMALVSFFAIFHGYAHGAEMPAAMGGLPYGAGFVAATALLHALGLLLVGAAYQVGSALGGSATRLAGGAMAAAGAGLMAGML